MNKKKIIFLCNSSLTIESFLIDHIKNISKNNYDVYIISNFEGNIKKFNNLNVNLINLSFKRQINLFFDFYCFLKIFFIFVKLNPYMIVSITPKAGLLSSIVSFSLNVKIRVHIFTGQVWANKKNFFIKTLLLNFDKLISLLSTHLLIDSYSQKNFLIKHGIIKNNKKAKVILNGSMCGVDTEIFINNNLKRNQIRKKLKINKKSLVLIYTGRINKEKGILNLVNIFSKLYLLKKNINLILIGRDEMGIRNILKNKNLIREKIKVIKHSKNIEYFLQASDIFCFPSEREGFGLSLIEASSCKLPVICSDIYGLRDTMIHNITGYRCNTKNEKKFLFYLKKLAFEPNLRIKLGNQGRRFVQKKFEKEDVILEFNKFFSKILSL